MSIFKQAQRRIRYENAMKKRAELQAETTEQFLEKVYKKIANVKAKDYTYAPAVCNFVNVEKNPFNWNEVEAILKAEGYSIKYLSGCDKYSISW